MSATTMPEPFPLPELSVMAWTVTFLLFSVVFSMGFAVGCVWHARPRDEHERIEMLNERAKWRSDEAGDA